VVRSRGKYDNDPLPYEADDIFHQQEEIGWGPASRVSTIQPGKKDNKNITIPYTLAEQAKIGM
jgi:hypothetical protein